MPPKRSTKINTLPESVQPKSKINEQDSTPEQTASVVVQKPIKKAAKEPKSRKKIVESQEEPETDGEPLELTKEEPLPPPPKPEPLEPVKPSKKDIAVANLKKAHEKKKALTQMKQEEIQKKELEKQQLEETLKSEYEAFLRAEMKKLAMEEAKSKVQKLKKPVVAEAKVQPVSQVPVPSAVVQAPALSRAELLRRAGF